MCRAVILKSVLCQVGVCQSFDSMLSKSPDGIRLMQTFSDTVTWTTLDRPTEARSWCYREKWTLSANGWIAKAVCSGGLHGRLRGVNRGAAAVWHFGLRQSWLCPIWGSDSPSPPALWALRSVAHVWGLPEGLIRIQSPCLSLCLPLINAHTLMNDSARADVSSGWLRSTMVSGGECFHAALSDPLKPDGLVSPWDSCTHRQLNLKGFGVCYRNKGQHG